MSLKEFLRDYGVLLTSCTSLIASFIALFKESINSFFMKPKLCFRENDSEKFISETEDSSDDIADKAISYVYKLQLANEGKGFCNNISVYLDKIEYKSSTDVNFSNIDLPVMESFLFSNNNQSVSLAPFSRPISFSLISIKNSASHSETKGSEENLMIFKVGNFLIPKNKFGGQYKIVLTCYSDNCRPKKIKVTLDWNGRWCESVSDFLKHNVNIQMEAE